MERDLLTAWNTFLPNLRKFVHGRVKDRSLTDDIIQDVFLKMYQKIDSVRDFTKVRSWIFTLTNNTIIDHFRSQSRQIDPGSLYTGDEATNFNGCVTNYLKLLIADLPEKYRQAIELTDLGGMTQFKLADYLGISVSGAKSRVQRARSMLRKKLEADLILEIDRYGNVMTCACCTPSCD
jgi:RNA polymerase sigma-70 factor (ECF subfamily)